MTEGEWLSGEDSEGMLAAVRQRRGDCPRGQRQARRFAFACACRLRDRLTDRRSLEALGLIERALRSPSMRHGVGKARNLAVAAEANLFLGQDPATWRATQLLSEATISDPWQAALGASLCLGNDGRAAVAWQCDLLRELFGNPFRLVVLPDGWRRFSRGLLARLANQAHATGDYAGLPILADALEDAGCTDAILLDHCRSPVTTHQRGCWAVELLRDED